MPSPQPEKRIQTLEDAIAALPERDRADALAALATRRPEAERILCLGRLTPSLFTPAGQCVVAALAVDTASEEIRKIAEELQPRSITDLVVSVDLLPWLETAQLGNAVLGRHRKARLVELLREAGDIPGRVALNNRLVALQNGEPVEGATASDREEAANLSLLWSMVCVQYVDEQRERER